MDAKAEDILKPDGFDTLQTIVIRPKEKSEEKFPYFFGGEVGLGSERVFSFRGHMGLEAKISEDAMINALAYLRAKTNTNIDYGNAGGHVGIDYKGIGANLGIGVANGGSRNEDSTFTTKTDIRAIQNGIAVEDITERTRSTQEVDDNKKFFGLGVKARSGNGILKIGYGNQTTKNIVEDNTRNEFTSIYSDSTYEIQGNGTIVTTKTDLLTRVNTNIISTIENNTSMNNMLIEGSHVFGKGNFEVCIGALVTSNKNTTRIRSEEEIITSINGQTIVRVNANGNIYEDTIQIANYQENRKVFSTKDFVGIKPDFFDAYLRYGKPNKTNGLFEAKIGMFDTDVVHFGNRLNFMINDKLVNSLRMYVNETAMGGGLRFGLNLLPKSLTKSESYNPLANISKFYKESMDIGRRVDISDEEKIILSEKKVNELARANYGPWVGIDIEKTYGSPSQWAWGLALGYDALDEFNIVGRFGYNSFKRAKDISAQAIFKNDLGLGMGYSSSDDNKEWRFKLFYVPK
ncbi:MAG: hypothetical protein K6T73_08405 [Candidatus Bathyarchaeota archaeon]|nr:hypothetical protein [Candidatus Bathyarchaeota archaeon]